MAAHHVERWVQSDWMGSDAYQDEKVREHLWGLVQFIKLVSVDPIDDVSACIPNPDMLQRTFYGNPG